MQASPGPVNACILTVNGGSSSIKFALFETHEPLQRVLSGSIERIGLPALNVQMTAQYVIYNKFNGGSDNYDGSGRNATDNNTLYLALWVLW